MFALAQCSEDEGPQMGCSTGIRKSGGTERKLIRCCTRKEHLAGNNVDAGGIDRFDNYTDWEWEPVSDCDKCRSKYP